MNVLLDTCVISEIRRPNANPRVVNAVEGIDESAIYLSAITIGEIVRGIERLESGRRRSGLEVWLEEIERNWNKRILPIDSAVARIWGEVSARLARSGIVVTDADGLIAASAIHYEIPVMTRNVRHFQHWGIRVIDPWSR